MESVTFEQLGLSKRVLDAIAEMGFEEPSPIQAQAIPFLMEGHDVIGQAQTGTGKTAAFGIPIIEKINPRLRCVQTLVLTPTRELAIQVAEEISKIGRFKGIRTLPIYGGQSIDRQIRSLRHGVHVVIGTPGRLIDHLNRKTLSLDNINVMVLDEADEMLDMGFIDDIEHIMQQIPEARQTLLFSATMPDAIQRLARKYLKQPKRITVSRDELTAPKIDQIYYEIREKDRLDALCRVLDATDFSLVIIFCRTKRGVDELTSSLQARGYEAEGLHGDLTQSQRDRVMAKFRNNQIEVLVATDVAARGIDVENVSHVVNYEVPQDPESYVHRIGRTGRAGRSGVAITMVVPREYRQLRLIEKLTKTTIQPRKLPSLEDVAEKQMEQLQERIISIIEGNNLELYRKHVDELAQNYELQDIAAAAIALQLDLGDNEIAEEAEKIDFGFTGARPGMIRFFVNIGRIDELTPPDIVQFIAEESGVDRSDVGKIKIYDRFSFVEIKEEVAEKVYYCLNRNTLKGRRINVEPAKGK